MASNVTHYANGCKIGRLEVMRWDKSVHKRGLPLVEFHAVPFEKRCKCCSNRASADGYQIEAQEAEK